MFTIIRTIKRPNTNTSFFPPAEKDKSAEEKFENDFVKTGLFISSHDELSDDRLTLTQTSQWRSRDDYINYLLTEPVIRKAMIHRDYNLKHNIVSVFTSPNVGEP